MMKYFQSDDLTRHEIASFSHQMMKFKKVLIVRGNDPEQLKGLLLEQQRYTVLIVPDAVEIGDGTLQSPNQFARIQLLIGKKLEQIKTRCFNETCITKIVGNKIQKVGDLAFNDSYFMQHINLKNADHLGFKAFSQTNIHAIRNNKLKELGRNQFEYNAGIEVVRMKNLEYLDVNVFKSTIVQTFDAPKLRSIIEQIEDQQEHQPLHVANSNFLTENNVERVPYYKEVEDIDATQICKEQGNDKEQVQVTQGQAHTFIEDNRVILPPNAQQIMKSAFYDSVIFQVFGKNVIEIGESAFQNATCLRSAEFPNAEKVGSYSFLCCYKLHTFRAPKCTQIGRDAFSLTMNLKTFVAAPQALECQTFYASGLTYLDLPSVVQTNTEALQFSKLEGINLENCTQFEEDALKNDFGLVQVQTKAAISGQVSIIANPRQQRQQLRIIQQSQDEWKHLKQKMKIFGKIM